MGTINYVCKRRPKYSGVFSFGNSKLPYTTAVFNMTSATDCPSDKRGLCQVNTAERKRCYALRTEKMFPKTCLVYKRKQADYWDFIVSLSAVFTFVVDLESATTKNKITALRFNESGDFRTQKDIEIAESIADILWHNGRVKTYCYTARRDLNFSKVKYLIIMGSGFTKPGIKGEFRAIKNIADKSKGFGLCCGDCTKCHRCIDGKNTVVLLH